LPLRDISSEPTARLVRDSKQPDGTCRFNAGRRYFAGRPGITGAQLYAEVSRLAREAGWSLGARRRFGGFYEQLLDLG
jgi:hypothetical protein